MLLYQRKNYNYLPLHSPSLAHKSQSLSLTAPYPIQSHASKYSIYSSNERFLTYLKSHHQSSKVQCSETFFHTCCDSTRPLIVSIHPPFSSSSSLQITKQLNKNHIHVFQDDETSTSLPRVHILIHPHPHPLIPFWTPDSAPTRTKSRKCVPDPINIYPLR